MNKIFGILATAILSIALIPATLAGQSKEKVMADILKKNEGYNTIVSNCTQVKTMKGMKKKIESKGTMYYVRSTGQMKMLFKNAKKEKENQLIISGDKVVNINGASRNVFNTKTDHNMNILKGTLMYCIGGQLENAAKLNKTEIAMTSNDSYYVFQMGVAKHAKGRWTKLEASFSKKDLSLCILTLTEKNGNTTTYYTIEKEFNTIVPEGIFNY